MNSEPDDFNVSTTCVPSTQEPLTFERMQRMIQELRDQYPEPVVEILSPTEYFRRNGYRMPISEETLAELAPAVSPLEYLLRRHIQDADIADSFMPRRPSDYLPEGALAVEVEKLFDEIRALASDTSWTISPKTYNQLQRMAARARRQQRSWLRAKRQRRARQRRHNRGLA